MSHDPSVEEVRFESSPGMFHLIGMSFDSCLETFLGGWLDGNAESRTGCWTVCGTLWTVCWTGCERHRVHRVHRVFESASGKLGKECMFAKIILCVWSFYEGIVCVPDGRLESSGTGCLMSLDAKVPSPIGREFIMGSIGSVGSVKCVGSLYRVSVMCHGHLRCRQGIIVADVCLLDCEIPGCTCPFPEVSSVGPFIFTKTEMCAPPLHIF